MALHGIEKMSDMTMSVSVAGGVAQQPRGTGADCPAAATIAAGGE